MAPFTPRSIQPGSRIARSRKSAIERLEPRALLAADFHNAFNPFDVNDDGLVAPVDALVVIHDLNLHGARSLASGAAAPRTMVDVSGDGQSSPLDALLVVNQLNEVGSGSVPLVASLAPQSDPNGNGVVLESEVTVRGQTSPGTRLRLSAAERSWLTTADAAGQFQFDIQIATGSADVQIVAADPQFRGGAVQRTIVRGDVILDWNATLLTIVRDWTTVSQDPYPNRIVTSPPPVVARNLAMVHVAMHDAVQAIEGTHQPVHADLQAPAGASPVAAASAAAHRVAGQLYQEPDERALLDAALSESLATVPDETARALGLEFGRQVGDAILAWRAEDGAEALVTYTPGTDAGDWNRTFPDYIPPLLPQWPQVTPFALTSGDQFRPAPPPALSSGEYAAAVNEVMTLGGLNSNVRTADQTDIALFWADGGGTSTPPGHWNQIAADVVVAQDRTLAENARLFALLNMALADAGISCWDAKYAYELWRPIDAIRQAALDGNPATSADPAWQPLIRTPPFPTYTSGHSTFSGAAEVVLAHLLGDNVSFRSRMDGHSGFTQRPLASEQILTRSFHSFAQAADEASHSRVYGGIHFGFDSAAGLAAGRAIGQWVVAHHR
ncbi:MAG: phosphatase PAP2 family protein [Pirellulaceae bacterium]|nr:phosphatase PAP2 family protein [Pirellulaceae bacterium]